MSATSPHYSKYSKYASSSMESVYNFQSALLVERYICQIWFTYCKPYLLYGSDVIAWNKSDLSSISHAFNSAMCKIYKVKFESLACIYQFTGQSDIVHDIQDRRSRFITSLHHSHNEVVSHLARAM